MTISPKMGKIGLMEQKRKQNLIFESVYHGETKIPITDFLRQEASISGRSLRQYFFKGLILLNHKKAHSKTHLKNNDLVQVYGVDAEHQALKPEIIPFDIVYEDENLLVINKPAGLAVHPSGNITCGTLANGVAAYFEKKNLRIKVRPVNRLDYGTSGLIIFAKKAEIQTQLTSATQNNHIQRIYYSIVKGVPSPKTGVIDLPIGHSPETKANQRTVSEEGRAAVTHYKVIEELNGNALLELSLKTGRTHQIRIHLSSSGFPILGDPQYGIPSPFIKRPALHAGKLKFSGTGMTIPELTAPFPEDFNILLEKLRSSRAYRK